MKYSSFLFLCLFASFVTACADHMPLPGGSDTINKSYYTTKEDFVTKLESLEVGMTENHVFRILEHNKDDLAYLKRQDIIDALYGRTPVVPTEDFSETTNNAEFIKSLYGYRLFFKITEREHGFTSPIRIRTDETGFDYEVVLIFRENALYVRPLLSGGIVNKSKSATLFDLLTPSTILDAARN